jgi:hypothetical protein
MRTRDPTNPAHRASGWQLAVIRQFNEDPQRTEWSRALETSSGMVKTAEIACSRSSRRAWHTTAAWRRILRPGAGASMNRNGGGPASRQSGPDRTVPPLGFGNPGGAVYVFELQDGVDRTRCRDSTLLQTYLHSRTSGSR